MPEEQTNPMVIPTCYDGVKNQNETDIDCGGRCIACEIKIPVVSPCAASLKTNTVTFDDRQLKLTAVDYVCSETYGDFKFFIYNLDKGYPEITILLDGMPTEDAIYPVTGYDYTDTGEAGIRVYDSATGLWYEPYDGGEIYVTVTDGAVTAEFCAVKMRETYWDDYETVLTGSVTCR